MAVRLSGNMLTLTNKITLLGLQHSNQR